MDSVDAPGPAASLVSDVFARACTSREAFEGVTSRWSSLVLLALGEGPHRFGELRRRVEGVSERMLAQALRGLERDGLVSRADAGTIPPRVDYALTPLGEAVATGLRDLADVLEAAVPAIDRARVDYDAR
ncbi:winged helix-turn-helix transcriptional regulator [Demequina iriomotensis]|uniref:winged helix-turn-helix transcriptional regulator n=1 Tax=Demequina iriomotensis TaxID=1536641 RepID=UPI00078645CA|nr:helix-turn-helix domain-containing protein [Demequina iriomotensis]